jgi:hypothetical protein
MNGEVRTDYNNWKTSYGGRRHQDFKPRWRERLARAVYQLPLSNK